MQFNECHFIISSPEPKLIGELIVYRGIGRLSSAFSNDFSSEADSFHIAHIESVGGGNQ